MSNIFISASQARQNTRNNSIIHAEVRSIESAVLANISAAVLFANVSTGTLMTSNVQYYQAYNGIGANATALKDQIDTVRLYFQNLGYNVRITENPVTGNTLVWNLGW